MEESHGLVTVQGMVIVKSMVTLIDCYHQMVADCPRYGHHPRDYDCPKDGDLLHFACNNGHRAICIGPSRQISQMDLLDGLAKRVC